MPRHATLDAEDHIPETLLPPGIGSGGDPTAEIEAAVSAHDVDPDCHAGVFSLAGHTHAAYSLTSHDHTGTYATAGHDHTGTYQPVATVLTNTTASFTTAQETKLAGIETAATADMTGAEIVSAINTNLGGSTWQGGGGVAQTVATLASDQATGANVTPVTLTGLVFTYAINSTYRIWFMGGVQPTAATTGCGFQFDLSSAVTALNVQFFHQLANTGTVSGGHSIADDASVGVSSGMPGTSTYPVTGFGLLVTTSNTGTAQLRFRSETTAVTTAKAGFTLVVEKIA